MKKLHVNTFSKITVQKQMNIKRINIKDAGSKNEAVKMESSPGGASKRVFFSDQLQ